MFETLMRLYIEGRLTEEKLNNAVIKIWITEEQKNKILNTSR
jgi:hypothetical protein